MPIRVNLKEVFSTDPQSIAAEKINFNFNKLLELGVGQIGPIGNTGPQGAAGPTGLTGADGDRGATWWVDFGDPSNITFTEPLIDGDLYINTEPTHFSFWSYDLATDTWTTIVNLGDVIDNYISSQVNPPFVRNLNLDSTFGSSVDRFIMFNNRADADQVRNEANIAMNDILFLTNFGDSKLASISADGVMFDSILKIAADHEASYTDGRYHIELNSVYDDGTGLKLSNTDHSLKIKYYKDQPASSWLNYGRFSLSLAEVQSITNITESSLFNFVTSKYVNSGTQCELNTYIGPANALTDSTNSTPLADGILFNLVTPTQDIYANIGIVNEYSSVSTRLDGKNFLMLDVDTTGGTNSGVLVDTKSYFTDDLNVLTKIGIGDIDATNMLHVGALDGDGIRIGKIGVGGGASGLSGQQKIQFNIDFTGYDATTLDQVGARIAGVRRKNGNPPSTGQNMSIAFFTSPDAKTSGLVEAGRFAGNGNLGLGIVSPSVKLHIKDSGEIVRLQTTDTTGSNYIGFYAPSGQIGKLGFTSTGADDFIIQNLKTGKIRLYDEISIWKDGSPDILHFKFSEGIMSNPSKSMHTASPLGTSAGNPGSHAYASATSPAIASGNYQYWWNGLVKGTYVKVGAVITATGTWVPDGSYKWFGAPVGLDADALAAGHEIINVNGYGIYLGTNDVVLAYKHENGFPDEIEFASIVANQTYSFTVQYQIGAVAG